MPIVVGSVRRGIGKCAHPSFGQLRSTGTGAAALFPHTLARLPVLFEGGPDEWFEFGLDMMIRGLASLEAGSMASD